MGELGRIEGQGNLGQDLQVVPVRIKPKLRTCIGTTLVRVRLSIFLSGSNSSGWRCFSPSVNACLDGAIMKVFFAKKHEINELECKRAELKVKFKDAGGPGRGVT